MNNEDFNKNAHRIVDWISDYYKHTEEYPVRSKVKPRDIFDRLPEKMPESGEDFEDIFKDFKEHIMPGITHWQSPLFFAYFPANASFPSILGEFLTSALGAQCMKWVTSPAASELEEQVMNWLGDAIGLDSKFYGVIQDTASTATLCSILTAREKYSKYDINLNGFTDQKFRVYCSTETHSSIEKDVKIAGIGSNNLVKIPVKDDLSMNAELLEKQIIQDKNDGFTPICIVSALGTTGTVAFDPLEKIAEISKKHNIHLHVDAAYAGSALILDEYKHLLKGIENVDTFVFNPHKWLMTNFDCSAYFVRDKEALIKTFQIVPEYLKTNIPGDHNDYADWGIQLGRRFRALKLWFVLRSFGLSGLQDTLRFHIKMAQKFEKAISKHPDFEVMIPRSMNLVCFRLNKGQDNLNKINSELLESINSSGEIFMTHTKTGNDLIIRFVCGNANLEERHIDKALSVIFKHGEKF